MSGPTIASLPPSSDLWNDMDHNVTIRPPKRPAPGNYSDRAQARMIRQKLIEHEQEIEDREALKVTSEELRILRDSFSSVKAEFTDLDGLSWDTPIARQILLNWHAQQASRASLQDELNLGDLAHRMRRAGHSPSPRRSLASIICPPGLSASAPDLSKLSTSTVNPEDDAYDPTATVRASRDSQHESHTLDDVNAGAFELTIRVRAHAGATSTPAASPASLPLGVSTSSENEQTPPPALFKSVPRECADVGRTPQPHRLSFDPNSVPDVELAAPVPTRSARPRPATLPKSHSAPCVPLARDVFLRSCSPLPLPLPLPEHHPGTALTKSERPIKRLPPSRIPIPRSKSLGATSAARLRVAARCSSASASAALPASASAPAVPSRAHQPRFPAGPGSPTRLAHRSPPARKPLPVLELPPRSPLRNSPTLNRDSAALDFEDPASPTSPSTKVYPLSPAHRGRVGYNYRPQAAPPRFGRWHDRS